MKHVVVLLGLCVVASSGCKKKQATATEGGSATGSAPTAGSGSAGSAGSRSAGSGSAGSGSGGATKLDTTPWPDAEAAVDALALQGPFPSTAAICTAFAIPNGRCETEAISGVATPFLEAAVLVTDNVEPPTDPNDPRGGWANASLALRTTAGWFLAAHVGFRANYTNWRPTATMVGERVVIAYESEEATEGRWGSENESGIIACGAAASGKVACTPKVASESYTAETEDREDPSGKITVAFRCAVSLAAGDHLVVTEIAKGTEGHPPVPGACAKRPYWGDHVVAFPR